MKINNKLMGSSSEDSFMWTNASSSSNSSIGNNKIVQNNMTRNGLEDDIVQSPKKKKIKIEPESDENTNKKKNKCDVSQLDESQNYSNSNITMEEEQDLASPPLRKKKQRRNTHANTSLNSDMEYDSNIIIKKDVDEIELQDTNCTLNNDESYTRKKKKKSRKRKHSQCDDDDNITTEDKGSEDIAEYPQHIKIEQTEEYKKLSIKKEKSKKKLVIKNEQPSSSDKSELSGDEVTANQPHNSNHTLKSPKTQADNINKLPKKENKGIPSISERIQFEDLDNSQTDTNINQQAGNTYSRKLKKFLTINQELTEMPFRNHRQWDFSANDEIWAIKCPQNMDVNAFLGTNIKLDKKCKIKFDNQTYIGYMNSETSYTTVLAANHCKYLIKKIPLSGTLRLHRKIPKVHVPDDNVIVDNQTDFVPLPDTKNRHPLFGSNYKKAIKLPSAVAQRLSESYSAPEAVPKKNKKKKNKGDKNKLIDSNNEPAEEIHQSALDNDTTVIKKKKNKKRKHESETEPGSAKRIKHTADSSAVWESEQAIEENLFNF